MKVFICEDHTIVLDGLTLVLKQYPEFEIIGHARNGETLLNALGQTQPDILILDLNLPDMDGLTVLEKIRKVNKEILIVILTMYNEEALVERSKKIGANAYLLKSVSNDELLDVLHNLNHDTFLLSKSLRQETENKKLFRDGFVHKLKLTERETEIIRLLAKGLSSVEIADSLHLSAHTINTHRKNILRKLEISSTVELVRFAHDNNIL